MTKNWWNQNQRVALTTKVGINWNYDKSKNAQRTYGKPNEQLSPNRWELSYLNVTLL